MKSGVARPAPYRGYESDLYWVRHSTDNLGVSTIDTISYALLAMAIFYTMLAMVAVRSTDEVTLAEPTLPAHPKTSSGVR
jgi:hypothetical protein